MKFNGKHFVLAATTISLAATCIAFTGCSSNQASSQASSPQEETEQQPEPEPVLSNDHITVDGIYVDESYVDSESSSLKMVYVFTTVTAAEKNIDIDSRYTKLNIGENCYESDKYGDAPKWTSYYYSQNIKHLYVGESCKLALAFKIPEADLSGSKQITLQDSEIPNIDQLSFSTDIIQHAQSSGEIAQSVDPEGYAAEQAKYAPADAETCAAVQNAIIGYDYYMWYSTLCVRIHFSGAETFELTSPRHDSGTYQVLTGYIALTYDGAESPAVYVPWSWKDNGQISLDLDAFLGE